MASPVERYFSLHIHGGGSWRHGAAEAWRQMCGDGTRGRSTLFGIVVASAAARSGKVDAAVQL